MKTPVPAANGDGEGRTALGSLELIVTVSFVMIRFQFASTAFTVTLKEAPAVWGDGEPVLPLVVPGAALSPGARTWSLLKAPTFTVVSGLVLRVLAPSLAS